jgi:hypothetical protein
MRVEGLFEPPNIEAFDLYDPRNKYGPFAVALVRWSSGERVEAWCIDGGCSMGDLPKIKGLDGRSRFTGPIISYHEPEDKSVVMAHVQGPSADDIFIIRQGYDGRCGIYDLNINPSGSYVDEEDRVIRQEALHHTQERDKLRIQLQTAVQETELSRLLLKTSMQYITRADAQIDRLLRELKDLERRGGVNNQKQFDLLTLGLGRVGFDKLPVVDQTELLEALERELYRALHPDRFIGLDRDTKALQTAATEIIQLKIAAIQRLKSDKKAHL